MCQDNYGNKPRVHFTLIFLFVSTCVSVFGLQMRCGMKFSTHIFISELNKIFGFWVKDYLYWQILTFANLIAISVYDL